MRSIYKSLAPGGFINYMGLPWFPGIADSYLYGAPGTMNDGRQFDLYHVYRYTHGAPDEASAYLPQLHKGLFDLPELEKIFAVIDPDNTVVYTYVYPGEPRDTRVTCGFYMAQGSSDASSDATKYLERWDGIYLDHSTLKIFYPYV